MTTPSVSLGQSSSIDEILDAKAMGLLHFERFLPLVARVRSSQEFPTYEQVCARYDEQRGLNLGALSRDADVLEALTVTLGDQHEEQVQLRRVLQMRWYGEAGDAVQTYLSSEEQAVAEFLTSIEGAHQTMSACVDVLRDAVTDKAELVGSLDIEAVDGKSADEIDAILLASGIECVPVDRESVFPRLATAFEELAERARSADVSDEFAAEAGQRCRDWIAQQFVPRMKATCDAVLDACASTDTAVRDSMALLVEGLSSIHDLSFGDLDERRWVIAPGPVVSEPWSPPYGSSVPPAPPAALPSVSGAPAVIGAPGTADPNGGAPMAYGGTDSSDSRRTGASPSDEAGDPLGALVDRVVAEIVDRVDDALSGAAPDDDKLNDRDADDRDAEDRDADDRDAEDRDADDRDAEDRDADDRDAEDRDADDRDADERPVDHRRSGDATPPSVSGPDGGTAFRDDSAGPRTETVPSSPPELSTPADPMVPGAVAERGHLEAELDGHRARIALEHDGALSLRLDTPGLGVRSFALRIGPFGLPEIVEIPSAADNVEVDQSSMQAAVPPNLPAPSADSAPTDSAESGSASTEPTPAPGPTPSEPPPSEPPPSEPPPSEPSPTTAPSERSSGAHSDEVQAQCEPESPTVDSPVRQDPKEDATDGRPSPAQHPVSADLPRPRIEAHDPTTGAGLSEAGTL
ncbi:hypothetical protein HQO83_09270 [Rhodococcus fascians]|nr:hypothetical protein [Rhodococcus fascians]